MPRKRRSKRLAAKAGVETGSKPGVKTADVGVKTGSKPSVETKEEPLVVRAKRMQREVRRAIREHHDTVSGLVRREREKYRDAIDLLDLAMFYFVNDGADLTIIGNSTNSQLFAAITCPKCETYGFHSLMRDIFEKSRFRIQRTENLVRLYYL